MIKTCNVAKMIKNQYMHTSIKKTFSVFFFQISTIFQLHILQAIVIKQNFILFIANEIKQEVKFNLRKIVRKCLFYFIWQWK